MVDGRVTPWVLQKHRPSPSPCGTPVWNNNSHLIKRCRATHQACKCTLENLHWHSAKWIHPELSKVIQLFTYFMKTFYLLLWDIICLSVTIYVLHSQPISKSSGVKSLNGKPYFLLQSEQLLLGIGSSEKIRYFLDLSYFNRLLQQELITQVWVRF